MVTVFYGHFPFAAGIGADCGERIGTHVARDFAAIRGRWSGCEENGGEIQIESGTHTNGRTLIKAAYGEIISVNKRYWRAVPKDVEIEYDDLGSLSLFDFDDMCGVDRKIYATRDMRKGGVMLESEYLQLNH